MKYQKGEYSFVPYDKAKKLKEVLYVIPRNNLPGARAGNEIIDDKVILSYRGLEKVVKIKQKRK